MGRIGMFSTPHLSPPRPDCIMNIALWRAVDGVEGLPIRAKSSLNPPSPLQGERGRG